MAEYPNTLAHGIDAVAGLDPFQLWAGEMDIVNSTGLAGAADIAQFTVSVKLKTGVVLSLTDAIAADATARPNCVTAQPIKAATVGPLYTGGCFNHAALIWPTGAAYDTLAERQGAFAGTPINVEKVL
jgi:hypothetical protein